MKVLNKGICLGFGEFTGACTTKAGSTHSPHFCQRCENLRLAHISKRLDQLKQAFSPSAGGNSDG